MTSIFLARTERLNLLLGLCAIVVSGAVWGVPEMLAAVVGVVLASANLVAIRRLATVAAAHAEQGNGTLAVGGLVTGLGVKMILLVALTWVVVAALDLAVLPFAFGIFALVVSLLISGFATGLSEEA
jgi:hypothetical protein